MRIVEVKAWLPGRVHAMILPAGEVDLVKNRRKKKKKSTNGTAR